MSPPYDPNLKTAVVNGNTVQLSAYQEANPAGIHKNKSIYRFGFSLRLAGFIGLLYVFIQSLGSGAFFLLYMLAFAKISLPSLLAIAVGHYLASNWKPRTWYYIRMEYPNNDLWSVRQIEFLVDALDGYED